MEGLELREIKVMARQLDKVSGYFEQRRINVRFVGGDVVVPLAELVILIIDAEKSK
jgi:hypothetical protein